MTAPPVNSDEDYYMDEPFDEESLSEVEEEQEFEDGQLEEESDSLSDTDVEAEYLRGNPHARRQQILSKRSSGGGSGFPRDAKLTYASSSSEDEAQVVITKTVAEVNHLTLRPQLSDEETISVRTLMPNQETGEAQTELEDNDMDDNQNEYTKVDDDLGEEEEIVSENEDEANDLLSEQSNEEKEDDVEVGQLEDGVIDGDEQDNQNETDDDKLQVQQNQDLVDIVDATDSDMESPHNTDDEFDVMPIPTPQKKKRVHKHHPDMPRVPIHGAAPRVPKLKVCPDDSEGEIDYLGGEGLGTTEQVNVKFLEQQMKQMSEMIMKSYRLGGGAPDNTAFEQLAMATKLIKKQGKHMAEMYMEEEEEEEEEEEASMSIVESLPTPTTVRSEELNRRNCRCPSNTSVNQPPQEPPFLMDECGQGDGLMRYPHSKQRQSAEIDCRVSSVTPSSYTSEKCGYHIEVNRPRSVGSSDVNYKNLGRKSFSFTNPQVREIERQNNILLKKMMNVKPTIKPSSMTAKSSTNMQAKKQPPPAPRLTSAAVNRKKYQRQIDLDNDVLKRKLEAVGSRRPLFK